MLILERLEHPKKSWFFDAKYLSDSLAIPTKKFDAQSFFEFLIRIPIPIPSKFSEKRMTHSPIPIPSRQSQDWFLRQKIERFFLRDFSVEEFREKHYCPYNFVPINWLWSGFISPELEHL